MSDILLGVIIGGSITLVGQIITKYFDIKGAKWKKYQDRLDLIFEKRMNAYKIMNMQIYALDKAISQPDKFKNVYDNVTVNLNRENVYIPPSVTEKLLTVINYASVMVGDPTIEDRQIYNNALLEAKTALQDLHDINWLPPFPFGYLKTFLLHMQLKIKKHWPMFKNAIKKLLSN